LIADVQLWLVSDLDTNSFMGYLQSFLRETADYWPQSQYGMAFWLRIKNVVINLSIAIHWNVVAFIIWATTLPDEAKRYIEEKMAGRKGEGAVTAWHFFIMDFFVEMLSKRVLKPKHT